MALDTWENTASITEVTVYSLISAVVHVFMLDFFGFQISSRKRRRGQLGVRGCGRQRGRGHYERQSAGYAVVRVGGARANTAFVDEGHRRMSSSC